MTVPEFLADALDWKLNAFVVHNSRSLNARDIGLIIAVRITGI
jgi:hypothetical protein